MTTLAKSDAKRVAIYDDTVGNIDMRWGEEQPSLSKDGH